MAVLHEQLLEQASHLIKRDPTRPRQASLRRAISAAYYAIFHCLVAAATAQLVGTTARLRLLRSVLARSFTHTGMARICQTFAGAGTPPKYLKPLLEKVIASHELRRVAKTFRDLLETREEADYAPYFSVSRTEAELLVDRSAKAIQTWERIPDDLLRRTFLLALLLGEGRR